MADAPQLLEQSPLQTSPFDPVARLYPHPRSLTDLFRPGPSFEVPPETLQSFLTSRLQPTIDAQRFLSSDVGRRMVEGTATPDEVKRFMGLAGQTPFAATGSVARLGEAARFKYGELLQDLADVEQQIRLLHGRDVFTEIGRRFVAKRDLIVDQLRKFPGFEFQQQFDARVIAELARKARPSGKK